MSMLNILLFMLENFPAYEGATYLNDTCGTALQCSNRLVTKVSNYTFPSYIYDKTSAIVALMTAIGTSYSFLSEFFDTSILRTYSTALALPCLTYIFPIFYNIFPMGLSGLRVMGLFMTLSIKGW